MFRAMYSRVTAYILAGFPYGNPALGLLSNQFKMKPNAAAFSLLTPTVASENTFLQGINKYSKDVLLKPNKVSLEQIKTVTKFSKRKGKRQSVRAVTTRFFRLHWGIWIRTIAGKNNCLWKKSHSRRNRLKQHVFCNATQSRMLDTMVSKFYRKPKYYLNDPYEPYHKREEFYVTRTKPWRPEGCDYE